MNARALQRQQIVLGQRSAVTSVSPPESTVGRGARRPPRRAAWPCRAGAKPCDGHVERRLAASGRAGGSRPACRRLVAAATSASAFALASASRRSRFIVMPSVGRRKRSSFASAADFATLASADQSRTPCRSAASARRGAAGSAAQRSSISLQPPQAGHDADARPRPGPCRSRRAPARRRSAAGSRSRRRAPCPTGAPTTGNGAYFSALVDLLALGDQLLDLAPERDVGGEQREAEIGADREVLALVVDHQRLDAVRPTSAIDLAEQRRACRRRARSSCWELEAGDAVADVPQRRRAVLQHRLAAARFTSASSSTPSGRAHVGR